MNFDEAVELAEEIGRHTGWTAEIEAGGEDEEAYITVSARYERHGLTYIAELERREQWTLHLATIERWRINNGLN